MNSLFAQRTLGRGLAYPLCDTVSVEDVTVMTLELKHLVIIFKLFEADAAHCIRVEDYISEGYRLHLIHYVQSLKPSFSRLQ